MLRIIAGIIAGIILCTVPAYAGGGSAEPGLNFCPSADAIGDTARYCVYDVPRLPSESPTFFIRKDGSKVTISPARAARKLTRWGFHLNENLFWTRP